MRGKIISSGPINVPQLETFLQAENKPVKSLIQFLLFCGQVKKVTVCQVVLSWAIQSRYQLTSDQPEIRMSFCTLPEHERRCPRPPPMIFYACACSALPDQLQLQHLEVFFGGNKSHFMSCTSVKESRLAEPQAVLASLPFTLLTHFNS